MSSISNIPHSLPMAYARPPILIGDNIRENLSQQPWFLGTSIVWARHVWCCVTDFSSLTALLQYLLTYKTRAQSPSPDGKHQIIFNFVKTCHESLGYANLFSTVFSYPLQTHCIVPVESGGADKVLIVPGDFRSTSHHKPFKLNRLIFADDVGLFIGWVITAQYDRYQSIYQKPKSCYFFNKGGHITPHFALSLHGETIQITQLYFLGDSLCIEWLIQTSLQCSYR